MHCTRLIVTSLISVTCLGAALPFEHSALADNNPPSKRGTKTPPDEGGISEFANLPNCDGTLISPFDRHASDYFGTSAIVRGDTMLVGAPGCDLQNTDNRGAVYFYYRSNGVWAYGQKTYGAMAGDALGGSAAMEGDYAVTGARYADAAGQDAGLAYPWHRTAPTSWSVDAGLSAWDGAAGDAFGTAVAMGTDWIAVSAPYKTMGVNQFLAGKVYLYRRFGNSWSWQQDFHLPSPQIGDALGTSLTMRGNLLAAGARGADVAGHQDAGKALVAEAFPVSANPFFATYTSTVVTASDAAANDHFGSSVALSDQFLYVAAPDADTANYTDIGAVYVFRYTGPATYQQVDKIVPYGIGIGAGQHFGRSVAVDGQNIVISDAAGFIYRYQQPNPNVSLTALFIDRRSMPADASTGYGQTLTIAGNDVGIGDAVHNFLPGGSEGAVHLLTNVPNDACANAITLSHGIFTGCTLNASNDGSSSCFGGAVNSADVWYTLVGTPANIGPWILRINSNYDSMMSAHIGACPGTTANEVACDDDSNGNFDARLNLNVFLGQTYLIRISGFGSDAGAFQLTARRNNCPADVSPAPLGDRAVNVDDLLMVITHWGACPVSGVCSADIVGNTNWVDVDDLLAVITHWGACPN